MALKSTGKNLCAFDTQIYPAVLDSGEGGLRDTREFGELALAQLLEFAQDTERLTHRDFDSLFCWTKFFHFKVSCNRER